MNRQIILEVSNQTQILNQIPQLIANKTNDKKQQHQQNILYQARSFPRSKVMNGRVPDQKIITIFRQYMQKKDIQTLVTYEAMYLVHLGPKSITTKLLEQKKYIEDDDDKISDIIMHPNGRQLLIFRRKSIQKCRLIHNKKEKTYFIQYGQSILLGQKRKFTNVQYHPSGEYVIGLFQVIKRSKNLQLFKLYHRDLKIQTNNQFIECCQSHLPLEYQAWNLAIDKDSGNIAMSAFYEVFCIIDTETLKFKKLRAQEASNNLNIIPTIQNKKSIINQSIENIGAKFKSINYIKMNQKSYFVAHSYNAKKQDKYVILTWRFDIQKREFVDKILLVQSQLNEIQPEKIKCIDLPNINSIACISRVNNTMIISQWDHEKNQTYRLFTHSLGVDTKNQSDYLLEDIFYYVDTAQVCYLFNGTITCSRIKIKCFENQTDFTLSRDCNQECFRKKSDWNPVSLKCQPCPMDNCECDHKNEVLNVNLNRCTLSCQKLDVLSNKAIPGSEYNNFTKCLCQPPYSWFDDLQKCRFNCSAIKDIDNNPNLNYSEVGISLCKCRQNYRFIQKIGSLDMQFGMCSLQSCPNNTRQVWIGSTLTCECDRSKGYKSNNNGIQQDCIYEVDKGLPGWLIALIVIFTLLIIGAIGFLIWKKWKKNKKDQEYSTYKEPGSPAFSVSKKSSQKQSDAVNSERALKQRQAEKSCRICNNNEQKINCKGPCDHYFHFNCIANNVKGLNLKCCECQTEFQIKDLILMNQNQGFAISD